MYRVGDLVISKSGRDCKRHFVVVEIIDDNYVNIADGALRKIEKPKKKKVKHLDFFGTVGEDVLAKLNSEKPVTNSELRKVLKISESI